MNERLSRFGPLPLVFLLLPGLAPAATFSFVGTASQETGGTLYTEHHRIEGSCQEGAFRPGTHQVEYRKPGQPEAFASKQMSYDPSPIRPSFTFRQPTFNEVVDVRYPRPETLVVDWQKPGDGREQFTVSLTPDLVVDSGFDNFVRRHWQQVTKGESVNFRFLAPTRGEHYAFVLEPVTHSGVKADHTVQIRPTGMVLQFLVDPIILGYTDSGALSDYLGLTNIRKDADENYTAHIRYTVKTSPDCELTP